MFDMLDHNEADAIITLDSHSYRKNYIIAQEAPLSMHFVTNANSKYAGFQGLKIQDIVSEPFILTEHSQGYRRVFDKELEKNLWILHRFWKSEKRILSHTFLRKAI